MPKDLYWNCTRAQGLALPEARIEVQDRPRLLRKVGVTWKDPVLVPPRLDGIGIQNPPHRAPTDRFAKGLAGPCGHIGQRLPTQGLLGFCDQFTGNRLDQCVLQRGKKWACALVLRCPPQKNPQRSTACANAAPATPKNPRVGRPPHEASAAPGGATRRADTAGRPDVKRSCAGPRCGLAG